MNSEAHVKRPMNCFMVWSREKRYNILKEHPGINNAEVSKALGAAWRKLSEEDKEPYVEEARRLTEQHKVENPGYKYQPKRRKNCKRSTRRPDKKITAPATIHTKSQTHRPTGEKIHLSFKNLPEPDIQQLDKMQGKPLVWFPPNHGLQCLPPLSFQPNQALQFCSCHFFHTAPYYHPTWAFESGSIAHHFTNITSTPCLRSYNVQEKLQYDRKVEPHFFFNSKQ